VGLMGKTVKVARAQGLAFTALLALVLSACTGSRPSQLPPSPWGPPMSSRPTGLSGQVLDALGSSGALTSIRVTPGIVVIPGSQDLPSLTPSPGTHEVLFGLTIDNLGAHPFDPCGLSVALTTSDGRTYAGKLAGGSLWGGFGPTCQILPDGAQLGYVTFEVPEASRLRQLAYRPTPQAEAVGRWELGDQL